jgi:arylsulfatase A-like enzyme
MKHLLALLLLSPALSGAAETRPNILVIVSDDHGYADTGFNGSRDIPTPNLDRLARAGIVCSNGYVSHPFCSPTRAGLLTGRYQQRFGHENNPFYDPSDAKEGLPLTETLWPALFRQADYATGWIGKWHLGATPAHRPLARGFSEGFGFIGGGHKYKDWKENIAVEYTVPIERDGHRVEEKEHLTTAFGREAAAFVARHAKKPWLLYLAFNAPHTPHEPTAAALERMKAIPDAKRRNYAAQLALLDDAVGVTLDALKTSGQDQRTLIFFFSDNGGPVGDKGGNGSCNTPLREGKGSMHEGGIRVPFVVSWPSKLPAGTTYAHPVSSLDVMATACAAAGIPLPSDRPLDSVNLIPHLSGELRDPPHQQLFWRSSTRKAVRMGDWKLVRQAGLADELYDLAKDVGETTNVVKDQPETAKRLAAALDDWDRQMIAPAFPGARAAKKKPESTKPLAR